MKGSLISMLKKTSLFLLFALMSFLTLSSSAQTLKFMDSNSDVVQLKSWLEMSGFLKKEYAQGNVFDLNVKNAIEQVQNSFELEPTGIATDEMQVICRLMAQLVKQQQLSASTSSPVEENTQKDKVVIPNIIGMTSKEALKTLSYYNLYVNFVSEKTDDPDIQLGQVFKVTPSIGSSVKEKSYVTACISSGRPTYTASTFNYSWDSAPGSTKDDWTFNTITIQDGMMEIKGTYNISSEKKLFWRNFGTAYIVDRSNTVSIPLSFQTREEEISRKAKKSITISIPISDLEKTKPTTFTTELELYVGSHKKSQNNIQISFNVSWN